MSDVTREALQLTALAGARPDVAAAAAAAAAAAKLPTSGALLHALIVAFVLGPCSYVAGQGTRRLHLPAITGYLLSGVMCGPYVLGILSLGDVRSLSVIEVSSGFSQGRGEFTVAPGVACMPLAGPKPCVRASGVRARAAQHLCNGASSGSLGRCAPPARCHRHEGHGRHRHAGSTHGAWLATARARAAYQQTPQGAISRAFKPCCARSSARPFPLETRPILLQHATSYTLRTRAPLARPSPRGRASASASSASRPAPSCTSPSSPGRSAP